jgi:hypothetical protein
MALQYYFKWFFQLLWLSICSCYAVLLSCIYWRNSNIPYWVGKLYCPIAQRLGGIKVTVQGHEHIEKCQKPFVGLGNHQGMFDLALYTSVSRTTANKANTPAHTRARVRACA